MRQLFFPCKLCIGLCVFLCLSFVSGAQNFQLKGTVTDDNGKPVAAATVTISKSSAATLSDSSGAFAIQAKAGDELQVKSVGYTDKIVIIANSEAIAIQVTPVANQLTDVIVTALGIKKEKRKVSYSTQEVKGETLQKAPETNVASNLVGKVAGLSVYTK